jgi:hypothetical protein
MTRLFPSVFVALPCLVLLVTSAARAETAWEVPGGDLFGFTSATDVGDAGAKGVAFETTARIGKPGGGTFIVPTLKTQFSWTPVEDTQIALSPFFSGFLMNSVPESTNRSFVGFDGFSAEASRRVIPRSNERALAVTVSAEARWARIDGTTGGATDSRSLTLKLFADRALVPNRLYAAANLNFTTGTARLRRSASEGRTESSGTDASFALTAKLTDVLFIGAETHWLESFSGNAAEHWQGRAFTAGPTTMLKLSDTVTLNAGWQAQVAGRKKGEGGPLNLADFDRHQVRMKLAMGF